MRISIVGLRLMNRRATVRRSLITGTRFVGVALFLRKATTFGAKHLKPSASAASDTRLGKYYFTTNPSYLTLEAVI